MDTIITMLVTGDSAQVDLLPLNNVQMETLQMFFKTKNMTLLNELPIYQSYIEPLKQYLAPGGPPQSAYPLINESQLVLLRKILASENWP